MSSAARLLALAASLLAPSAGALVQLGDPLPPHPWASAPREIIAVYGEGCGDPAGLWRAAQEAQAQGLPVRAVFAQGRYVKEAVPEALQVWRGPQAAAFSRQLKTAQFPTLLLAEGGQIMGVWEGAPDAGGQWRAALGLSGADR